MTIMMVPTITIEKFKFHPGITGCSGFDEIPTTILIKFDNVYP